MRLSRSLVLLLSVLVLATLPLSARGQGLAEPWQMTFQPAASPVMERIASLNGFITLIMAGVVLLVLVLLAVVVLRFNARTNPKPASFTHNVALEVAWTALPVAILVVVAVPSFKLLYFLDRAPDAAMTIKAVGHQWYWSYEYPDHGNFTFDSLMKDASDLQPGEPRLLAVDNEVVVPAGVQIRILTTSTDVIHSWAVPALGVKTDSNPGRSNETWIQADRPGVYYGQCSELCGVNHGFMPIAVRALPPDEFAAWVKTAQQKFARADAPRGADVASLR